MRYYEDLVVGESKLSGEFELTKENIIEYAKEWDPQPFHIDEVAAKDYPMGLIASSAHLFSIAIKLGTSPEIQDGLAGIAGLGWDNMRISQPGRPGDRLRLKTSLQAKRESKSRQDVGIMTALIELINQKDEPVLSYTSSMMVLKNGA